MRRLPPLLLGLVAAVAAAAFYMAKAPAGWELTEAGRLYGPSGQAEPPKAAPVAGPRRLRVLTWNIAYGYGRGSEAYSYSPRPKAAFDERLDRIAALIRRVNPDVVLLQETDFHASRSHDEDQLARLKAACGFPYAAAALSWSANYVPFPALAPARQVGRIVSGGGVLSRLPIVSQAVVYHERPPGRPFWYNAFYLRRYSQVVTLLADGTELVVINNHLEDTDPANRLAQASRLAALAQTSRALVAGGDLNAAAGDPALLALRAAPGLKDVLVEAHGGAAADGGFKTFPSQAPTQRLDHLMARADETVEKAEVLAEAGEVSDHLPLLLVVGWGIQLPSTSLMAPKSSAAVTGLRKKRTSREMGMRSTCMFRGSELRNTTGMSAIPGCARNRSKAPSPPRPGISKSSKTTSGRQIRAASTPAAPSAALCAKLNSRQHAREL